MHPKHTRDLPGNRNEAIFMDNVNHLATTRAESLVIMAKLLQLYNDYRVNVFRKPQPFFLSEGEPFILPNPPQVDPETNMPLNTPAVGPPQNIPMPAPLPNPIIKHLDNMEKKRIDDRNRAITTRALLAMHYAPQQYQQVFDQSYPSPYEEDVDKPKGHVKSKSKRKNLVLDAMVPWQPGQTSL
jgi:hypothetical protein